VRGALVLRNCQRVRAVDLHSLRRITKALLCEFVQTESFDLGVYLVSSLEMTRLNETFLRHQGSTDVITFDYSEIAGETSRLSSSRALLHGEIFICVEEAVAQARQFRASWQSELARYLIHGILHLQGYDDLQPAFRRKMRLKENQLLRKLAREFDLAKISPSQEASPKP
jgi:probable rRNA maturation factor